MLCRVLIFLLHLIVASLTFGLVHSLSLPFPKNTSKQCSQSPDFLASHARRIRKPSKRQSLLCQTSSTSSLYDVSCCQSPSVPFCCCLFRVCQNCSGSPFFQSETFPHFAHDVLRAKAAHNFPRQAFCSTSSLQFEAATCSSPCFNRPSL